MTNGSEGIVSPRKSLREAQRLSIILVVSLIATATGTAAFAQVDPAFAPTNWYYKKVLNFCTPYSSHIGVNMTEKHRTTSCASLLGMAKSECDIGHYKYCFDSRYTKWLGNEYGSYPAGTWDFIVCNPGPGCAPGNGTVRP